MELFSKRPLALYCALFALVSVIGCLLPTENPWNIPWVFGLFLVFFLLFGMVICFLRGKAKLLSLFLGAVFLLSAILISQNTVIAARRETVHFSGERAVCHFDINEIGKITSYTSAYSVSNLEIEGIPIYSNAIFTLPYNTDFKVGDRLSAAVMISSIGSYSDIPTWYMADGIFLHLELDGEEPVFLTHKKPLPHKEFFNQLRDKLYKAVTSEIEGEEGKLTASLLLGKKLLSNDTVRDFKRTGTSHLLAISGMHLTVLVGAFDLLLRLFTPDKRKRTIFVLVFALFYTLLSGMALSSLRAFIMCAFLYLAFLFRSENDPPTSLFFAIFFILAIFPCAVYDIGMWMSASAVLGILVANTLFTEFGRKATKEKRVFVFFRKILGSLAISFSAGFFVSLPMWLAWGELSLISVLGTLLLSPTTTGLLLTGPLLLLLGKLPVIGTVISSLVYALAHMTLKGASALSHLPHITVSFLYPFYSTLVPIAVFAIALLLLIKLRHKQMIPLSALAILLAFALCLGCVHIKQKDEIAVTFGSNGKSEFLLFDEGKLAVACDLSNGSLSAMRLLDDMANAAYVTELDVLLMTHYHTEHIQSIKYFTSTAIVRTLYLPLPETNEARTVCQALLTIAQEEFIDVHFYDKGTPLQFGDLRLTVFQNAYLERSVHPILSLSAQCYNSSLLYIGSSLHEHAERYSELAALTEDADTVIFGTHGPIPKTSFAYPLTHVRLILLADNEFKSYLKLEALPTGKVISPVTRAGLRFDKETEQAPVSPPVSPIHDRRFLKIK